MTVALTRTKAEQAFPELFEVAAPRLPGGAATAEARKAAIGAFVSLGLPHRRIEEWKYTDLRSALKEALPPAVGTTTPVTQGQLDTALAELAAVDAHRVVLVDGAYRPELSAVDAADVAVTSLAAALAEGSTDPLTSARVPGQEAVVALNTAFLTDGAVVRVAEGARPAKPLLLVFVRASREPRLVTVRNRLDIGAGAQATVIEAHVALPDAAPGQANALTEVHISKGASLVHPKCTLEGAGATHLGSWLATIGAGATYQPFQVSAGTGLVRNHLAATFAGEGGKIDVAACFLGRDGEHIDTTLVIDHAVPGCVSRELVKGVLAGRARGIFQGKVIVRPDAQKTDGKQMAQALMLSEEAEFDSKPELEIFADDVVCGHGSTAAQLDEDMLFYLRSRGIPLTQARALLIESFVGEVFDKLENERLREALWAIARARLAGLIG
ncbi:MAG TPA: Fe-S cluster assembly protein SufD [Hyphomicrobiaceae bacterium]|nr:Fe-S cluster assembly protein SufD [Hyphomicrobiaceae bacterium]